MKNINARKLLVTKSAFATALSVAISLGCSYIKENKRIPASVNDVGVIGSKGDVILFYKIAGHIIVKNCDPHTTLGLTPAEARANCKGKVIKVSVETFKQAIRNLVSTDRLNTLAPLTPEEIQAYTMDNESTDQMDAMLIELDKINSFISEYGAENANLVRKKELVSALRTEETRLNALKKINDEIEKTLDLITEDSKLTMTTFNSDKDQFLYTILKNLDPSKKLACGLKGTIDERISDCSTQLTSENEGFVLVTRTKDSKEVHKDSRTGLLWGDRLPSKMVPYDAEKACNSSLSEVAKITEVRWRLPSIGEYNEAEKNGIRKALPNMNYVFWAARMPDPYYMGWFDGRNGYSSYAKDYEFSVRCVAR